MTTKIEIPSLKEMTECFQEYISKNDLSTSGANDKSLSRHATKFFTKLGKDLGFYVRAPNTFKNITSDILQYPNDGGLLDIDLVWLTDNPYHVGNSDTTGTSPIYDFYNRGKENSEIALAFEYERVGGILNENDKPIHQCDELWKLSFVMARVNVLIYTSSTDNIEKHLRYFRTAISNFKMKQQPESEWRIFAINDKKVIPRVITPNMHSFAPE